jgi:molybdopterin converting factor small subunit
MNIRVLFFGATADLAGKRFVDLGLADSVTAIQAVETVVNANPKLEHHKLLFAINQEYLPADSLLKDGDEVAIFTAVSGG